MTIDEFCARLASFSFVDRDMIPEISDERWPLFRDHPLVFFDQASHAEREAIWRASESIEALIASTRQEYGPAGDPLPRAGP